MDGGAIKEGFTPREAKEVVTSGTTMLSALMKHRKEIVNMERLRKLESAVIEVLREEDPAVRERVVARWEERLAAV
jgi:hypothetical protein